MGWNQWNYWGKRGGFLLLDDQEGTGRCTFPNLSTQYYFIFGIFIILFLPPIFFPLQQCFYLVVEYQSFHGILDKMKTLGEIISICPKFLPRLPTEFNPSGTRQLKQVICQDAGLGSPCIGHRPSFLFFARSSSSSLNFRALSQLLYF